MSARFTITYDGEVFEAEVTPGGELVLPGHEEQLEYEIAFAAMGGDKSIALRLLDEWQENPTMIITHEFSMPPNTLALLAADWAEHVLPIFEHAHPKDKRPRKAIRAVRDFVAGRITSAQLERVRTAAGACCESLAAAADAALYAAAATAYAVDVATRGSWAAASAAWDARDAAPDTAQERTWQVRRFVDVMTALQAGKDWPPLGATP